jgi:TonB family protein
MIGPVLFVMIPKKLFITTIVISIAGHLALLAMMGFTESTRYIGSSRIFKVHLEKQPDDLEKKTEIVKEKNPVPPPEETRENTVYEAEDTVDLDSTETRYHPYLVKIKSRIEIEWSYPRKASTRRENGTTVVKFSITEEGFLAGTDIISSSGYELLDAESIHAIEAAAPFPHFPDSFHLSRLNILAKFNYKLSD